MRCSLFNLAVIAMIGLAGVFAMPVQAGVVIERTRVVYPAQDREVTVQLTNDDEKTPILVQAWIDDGREKSAPDQLDVPFLLVPPVFRIDPGKGQSLRITYLKNKPLPADKESVFWLNVLEIPPKPKKVEGKPSNTMQLAFRTRIKLFFRPAGLKPAVADAPGQLRWKVVNDGEKRVLQAENPSPYYLSFESVALVVNGKEFKNHDPQMIAPGGTQSFPIDGLDIPAGAKAEVTFTTIDDYGSMAPRTAQPVL